MTTSLVVDTLQTALIKRNLTQPLLFHTDRGTLYISREMRQFLDSHSITYSYSKKEYPWDNAVTESFFKHMKKEELDRRTFKTIKEVTLQYFHLE